MKLFVTGLEISFNGTVSSLANASMKVFGHDEKLKVVCVVFIAPVILNVLQVGLDSSSF